MLVLRHELDILRRQGGRPKLTMVDRALLQPLRITCRTRCGLLGLVTPRTLVRWHRCGVPKLTSCLQIADFF
jgi:putative transposase